MKNRSADFLLTPPRLRRMGSPPGQRPAGTLIKDVKMWQKFVVKMDEKGVLTRDGDFRRILEPGRYRFCKLGGKIAVSTWPQDAVMNASTTVEYLLKNQLAEAEKHFVVMSLQDNEAGLRFENDLLVEVLPPGARRFIWKGMKTHRLERFDLDTLEGSAELPKTLVTRLNVANLKNRAVAGLEGILLAQVPAYLCGRAARRWSRQRLAATEAESLLALQPRYSTGTGRYPFAGNGSQRAGNPDQRPRGAALKPRRKLALYGCATRLRAGRQTR
jgi:hypothetical protein